MGKTSTAIANAVDKSRSKTTDTNALEKAGSFRETLGQFLETNKEQIKRALPSNVSAERLIRVAMTAVNVNPVLQKCTLSSMYIAIVQSAQLNLECDGLLGQAWLVPYGNEAKFMIGYQGYLELIYRAGYVSKVYAKPVYKGDEFTYSFGSNQHLNHVPLNEDKKDEDITHFYAFAKLKDGTEIFEVKTKAEVDKVRATSKAKDSAPWRIWYGSMGCKTVLRSMMKWLPKSADQNKALKVEEAFETDLHHDIAEIEPDSVETIKDRDPRQEPAPDVDQRPDELALPPPPPEATASATTMFDNSGNMPEDDLEEKHDKPKHTSAYSDLLRNFDNGKTQRDYVALMKEAKTSIDKGLITQVEFKEILANTNKMLAHLKKK